jgi:hypothetical protein
VLLTDDSGWVANARGGTLTKLNRESEQLGVFPVGEEPNAMVFDVNLIGQPTETKRL